MSEKIKNLLFTFLMFLLEVVILLIFVVAFKLICISTKFIPGIGENVYNVFMFVDLLSFFVGIFITTLIVKRFFRNVNLKRRSLKWLGRILLLENILILCANIGSYMGSLAADIPATETGKFSYNIIYNIINICSAIYCLHRASSIEENDSLPKEAPRNRLCQRISIDELVDLTLQLRLKKLYPTLFKNHLSSLDAILLAAFIIRKEYILLFTRIDGLKKATYYADDYFIKVTKELKKKFNPNFDLKDFVQNRLQYYKKISSEEKEKTLDALSHALDYIISRDINSKTATFFDLDSPDFNKSEAEHFLEVKKYIDIEILGCVEYIKTQIPSDDDDDDEDSNIFA